MANSHNQQAIDFSRLRINNSNSNQLTTSNASTTTTSTTGDISNKFGHYRRSDGAADQRGQRTAATPSGQLHKGHQRRQSVARLLPDISKLRLLSWLVEASNELINCDIAIMDGVYAKLNRSRESLLFWQQTNNNNNNSMGAVFCHPQVVARQQHQQQQQPSTQLPPPPPSSQPVANKFVISNQHKQTPTTPKKKPSKQVKSKLISEDARTHHSLPLTNYDASSLAAISVRSSKTMPTTSERTKPTSKRNGSQARQQVAGRLSLQETSDLGKHCDSQDDRPDEYAEHNHRAADQIDNVDDLHEEDYDEVDEDDDDVDDDDDDEEDDRSSSSTASSGIPGASMSSSASSSSSSSASSSCGSSSFVSYSTGAADSASRQPNINVINQNQNQQQAQANNMTSAEYLSERIRQTLMEHNYLQGLLVNIIRQHDKRRDCMLLSRHQTNTNKPLIRVDLADIAESLDDGCLCSCHSSGQLARSRLGTKNNQTTRASTLPTAPTPSSPSQVSNMNASQSRKATTLTSRRRLKKLKQSANSSELSRDDLIQKMSDKLCENCFETHYWLHGCSSIELTGVHSPASMDATCEEPHETSKVAKVQDQSNDAAVSLRNATFIKLVQQQVRTTISKSIELIDLIRKEIKSPESIKQKQLMRYFSSSIQLLSSVANYVVPSQDISSFIPPEINQHHRNPAGSSSASSGTSSLFNLPPLDFDHLLLLSPSHPYSSSVQNVNYHLAPAPEIPPRRRQLVNSGQQHKLLLANNKVTPDKAAALESSSGASSNNSSASSSIARSQVQSSLSRAITSGSIHQPDDKELTSNKVSSLATAVPPPRPQPPSTSSLLRQHNQQQRDLSLESMAVMASRQQSGHQVNNNDDDDLFFHSSAKCSAKFWQSSKFNFIRKLLHVKQQRLLRQQSKDRRIYNNKVQNKFRLVMMDLTHFNKSQQLLTTENGVNSLLTSMRNVAEFGLYLTLKLY